MSFSRRLKRSGRASHGPTGATGPAGVAPLLVLTCVECPSQVAVPMEKSTLGGGMPLTKWLMENGGWVLSVRPVGDNKTCMLGPVCRACAKKVFDAKLLAAADEQMGRKEPS